MRTSNQIEILIEQMRVIQQSFLVQYGVNDIWSNSKIYEVLQANTLSQQMIPGHSGSLDAKDSLGREYEYKHFKESSSNHSWTFNDYSEATIEKLSRHTHEVIFAHINDRIYPPVMDWAFHATGGQVADYLGVFTQGMTNRRRMINISPNQLRERLGLRELRYAKSLNEGPYAKDLVKIFKLVSDLEEIVGVENILTSNKFWEVLVSLPLGHVVNSEQGGRAGAHDAFDSHGGDYEYKVSSSRSWNFQDISPAVLKKYLNCEEIVLAIVDKPGIRVSQVWFAKPHAVVARLQEKLRVKELSYAARGKEIRRQQASLSAGDLVKISARRII
jgi:hypothetical protein